MGLINKNLNDLWMNSIFKWIIISGMEINSTSTVNTFVLANCTLIRQIWTNRHFCMNIVFQYATWQTPIALFQEMAPRYKWEFIDRKMSNIILTTNFRTYCCREIWITTCIFTIAPCNIVILNRNISFANIDIGFKSSFSSFQTITTLYWLLHVSAENEPLYTLNKRVFEVFET